MRSSKGARKKMKKRNQVKRRRHKDLVVVDLKDLVQNSKAGSHRHVDEGGKVFSRGGRQPPDPDPNRFSVDCNAPVPLSWAEVGGARMPTRPRAVDEETATWLILPVVICLSQRLSHACVSINSFVL